MTIYVGNLSFDVTQDDLVGVFSDYGTVKKAALPTDRETGKLRGFAFVDLANDESELEAIEALDGASWMGRNMKVNKARPRER